MNDTTVVSLRSMAGTELHRATIPVGTVGPEVIWWKDQAFVRKTHDVYHLATCVILPS